MVATDLPEVERIQAPIKTITCTFIFESESSPMKNSGSTMFTPIHKVIKRKASKGDVRIEHIELTHGRIFLDNLRYLRDGKSFMCVAPGRYTRLIIRNQLVMSDTQMEQRTNREFVIAAHGHVLIAGLGLGLILPPILKKENVLSVTVIEKEQDVISLVAQKHRHRKLTVCNGDAFSYEPSGKFDCIYLDIWPDINTDNLKAMTTLKKRYRRWLNKDNQSKWIGCWPERELRAIKRMEDSYERRW